MAFRQLLHFPLFRAHFVDRESCVLLDGLARVLPNQSQLLLKLLPQSGNLFYGTLPSFQRRFGYWHKHCSAVRHARVKIQVCTAYGLVDGGRVLFVRTQNCQRLWILDSHLSNVQQLNMFTIQQHTHPVQYVYHAQVIVS